MKKLFVRPTVEPCDGNYWLIQEENDGNYLRRDGTIQYLSCDSEDNRFETGWWKTKSEAEIFLKEYLMKEQVQKKIEAAEKELEAAKLELKNLDRNLPRLGKAGQVYEYDDCLFMLAALSSEVVGFTVVSGCPGCYDSSFVGKYFSCSLEAFEYMKNNTDARYVGEFSDLFERRSL